MKKVLTIAGSDCSGGAGVQADLKTMTANGVYGMSVITALTAQNTTGVRSVRNTDPDFFRDQLDAVFEDIFPDSIKTGMIADERLIVIAAERLRHYKAKNIVVDPVMVATSGASLSDQKSVKAMTEHLFPISSLVTPNIPEAEVLSGMKIFSKEARIDACKKIFETSGCSVLIKGGHDDQNSDDILYHADETYEFGSIRIDNPNTHGTGCTLSSAIACNLAKGMSIPDSVSRAKKYVTGAISAMLDLGYGRGPLDHGFDIRTDYKD